MLGWGGPLTCELPGCQRPRWESNGTVHDYCGRSHALQATRGHVNAPHGNCHQCKLDGCEETVYFEEAAQRVHDFCCKGHADIAIERGDQPRSERSHGGDGGAAAAVPPAQRCCLPGCSSERFTDADTGYQHDFCGRTHAASAEAEVRLAALRELAASAEANAAAVAASAARASSDHNRSSCSLAQLHAFHAVLAQGMGALVATTHRTCAGWQQPTPAGGGDSSSGGGGGGGGAATAARTARRTPSHAEMLWRRGCVLTGAAGREGDEEQLYRDAIALAGDAGGGEGSREGCGHVEAARSLGNFLADLPCEEEEEEEEEEKDEDEYDEANGDGAGQLQGARRRTRSGALAESERWLRAALAAEPADADTLFNLGNVLANPERHGGRDVGSAAALYRRAAARYADWRLARGNALLPCECLDEVENLYNLALLLHSTRPAPVPRPAGARGGEACAAEPPSAEAAATAAAASAEAEALLRLAIRLDPQDVDCLHLLGWLLHTVYRDYGRAEECYRAALAAGNPAAQGAHPITNWQLLCDLGWLLHDQAGEGADRQREARGLYRWALEEDEDIVAEYAAALEDDPAGTWAMRSYQLLFGVFEGVVAGSEPEWGAGLGGREAHLHMLAAGSTLDSA